MSLRVTGDVIEQDEAIGWLRHRFLTPVVKEGEEAGGEKVRKNRPELSKREPQSKHADEHSADSDLKKDKVMMKIVDWSSYPVVDLLYDLLRVTL